MPGVNVLALARAHGLALQQVFGWRGKALAQAKTKARTKTPAFAVLAVAGTAPAASSPSTAKSTPACPSW